MRVYTHTSIRIAGQFYWHIQKHSTEAQLPRLGTPNHTSITLTWCSAHHLDAVTATVRKQARHSMKSCNVCRVYMPMCGFQKESARKHGKKKKMRVEGSEEKRKAQNAPSLATCADLFLVRPLTTLRRGDTRLAKRRWIDL